MAPIGGEFGSPDFERLMQEDAADTDEHLDGVTVEAAPQELGHDVSVAAAAVWEGGFKS